MKKENTILDKKKFMKMHNRAVESIVLIIFTIIIAIYYLAFAKYVLKLNNTVQVSFVQINSSFFVNTTTLQEYTELQVAIDEAEAGETIKLLKSNVQKGAEIISSKSIVLDLNGKSLTIEALEDGSGELVNNGTLTITDTSGTMAGVITSPETTIENTGNLSILNGKIFATESTTIENPAESIAILNTGTVTIGVNNSTISSTNPEIQGENYGIKSTSGTVNYYDGIIRGATNAYLGTITNIPTNYDIVTVINSKYDEVKIGNAVAQIDTKKYASLTDAISSIKTSSKTTITMLKNVSTNTYSIPSNRIIEIDLNSKTISSDAITITNSGTLIIKDTTGNGIISTTSATESAICNNINATITIGVNDTSVMQSNLTILGGAYAIYNNGGTVSFYDGTLKGTTAAYYGTINNLPTGYQLKVGTDDAYITATLMQPVAQIETTYYETLAEAIETVLTDGTQTTITIIANASDTTCTIEAGQNIILNLNSKAITSAGTAIINNGTLLVKDTGTRRSNFNNISIKLCDFKWNFWRSYNK